MQAPDSLDLSNKTFLTSCFPLPRLTVSYLFPCGFCPYGPRPSHGLWVGLSSLNPLLITPWFQTFLVLKAEFFDLLDSPDSSLCQSVWDRLGPGTLCWKACTWTHLSLSYKIQRNYCGTRNNCVHVQFGQIVDQKIQRKKTSANCHFWRAWSKNTGCVTPKQGTAYAPLHSAPQRDGQTT